MSFCSGGQKFLFELVAISTFKPLLGGFATTLTDSDELTVNLRHCPLGWKLTVDGSGDSDGDAVLGVRVGVGVALRMVMLYVRAT